MRSILFLVRVSIMCDNVEHNTTELRMCFVHLKQVKTCTGPRPPCCKAMSFTKSKPALGDDRKSCHIMQINLSDVATALTE